MSDCRHFEFLEFGYYECRHCGRRTPHNVSPDEVRALNLSIGWNPDTNMPVPPDSTVWDAMARARTDERTSEVLDKLEPALLAFYEEWRSGVEE